MPVKNPTFPAGLYNVSAGKRCGKKPIVISALKYPYQSRLYHGRCEKCGPIAAEKITKRRFTTIAVANTTHTGALAAISGSDASCAEPAKTTNVMPSACHSVRPDLTMAMPDTMPQAKIPGMVGPLTLNPSLNAAFS